MYRDKQPVTEIKNILEGINNSISEAEQISELEDKMVEITSEEQNKVKRMKRTESETSGTISNAPTFKLQGSAAAEEEKKKGYEKIYI